PLTMKEVADAKTAYLMEPGIATVPANGQRVAMAKASRPDDTTFEVESFNFTQSTSGPKPSALVGFLPAIEQAAPQIEAIRPLSGLEVATPFKYATAYIDHEFSAQNAGQLLMEVVSSPPSLDFSKKTDRSGGLVSPSLVINGLSRLAGPVSGML